MPLNGLSFLFFMGNYGFTPFGIHKESAGEEGFLFHLGPGNKQFYTWDNTDFNAIEHNTKVFHEFDDMMPDAKCYELKPGDAMFIPHNVYHIANTSEFSISFVMDYINPPMDKFENQLLQTTGDEAMIFSNKYLQPVNLNASTADLKAILNPASILQKLETILQRKLFGCRSNGGILRPSNSLPGSMLPNGNFTIQGKAIFPLVMDETADKTLIFARGHQLAKPKHPNLSSFIHQLNNQVTLDLNEIQQLFEPEWTLADIFSLIDNLLRVEAVVIVTS